ncbi:hypothetical protein [Rubrobacter marinus]|uniref:hypothetical protein n=1 Tax=Rubrobacter marinus TaxID=2653852 RepID=UPI001A9D88C0|nr:hypothetical protein [Rubrobacter marinus]
MPDDMNLEARVAGLDPSAVNSDERPGELSRFTCPDCTGPLYEIRDGELVRYRCRVGHAFTAGGVLEEKTDAVEDALYVALNTLEESAMMADGLANRAREGQYGHAVKRFEARAHQAREQAETIRRVLMSDRSEGEQAIS